MLVRAADPVRNRRRVGWVRRSLLFPMDETGSRIATATYDNTRS